MNGLRWQSQVVWTKPPWYRNILLALTCFLLFSILTLIYIEYRLSPVIYVWAESRAINLGTQLISIAVEETMASNVNTAALTHFITDSQGGLQAIQYDTGEINRLYSIAAQKIQQSLAELAAEEYTVPLGQLIGLDFLAAWGPAIPVRFIPVGSVETTTISSFNAAGINQTWHRIYLDIKVNMRVAVPMLVHEFPVQTRVPIVEEVIIGSVPSWYFAPGGVVGGFSQPNQTPNESSTIEFDLFNFGL